MEENVKTNAELLDEQIKKTLEELDDMQIFTDDRVRPALDKLRVLYQQQLELKKLEAETDLRKQELDARSANDQESRRLEERKIDIEEQKLEADTAIRIKELEIREANDKEARRIEQQRNDIEAQKAKSQKNSDTAQVVIGGVTAATGIAGILASMHCFKKGIIFEQTGSYSTKTSQQVGGLMNLFRKK